MAEVIHRYVRDQEAARERADERAEIRGLDTEYRRQRNIALQAKNHREQMALTKSRGELIEKKVAVIQASYLIGACKRRVLSEPASLARRLIQNGFINASRRLEVEMMIKNDLYEMLEELSTLPEKVTNPEDIDNAERISSGPVGPDGHVDDFVPSGQLARGDTEDGDERIAKAAEKAERIKRRRLKMRRARRAREKKS
jgi:hypothetical protein